MEINNIVGLAIGLPGITFTLAYAILERSIARNGLDAITASHIGVRLLVASGVLGVGAMFTVFGAMLATASPS